MPKQYVLSLFWISIISFFIFVCVLTKTNIMFHSPPIIWNTLLSWFILENVYSTNSSTLLLGGYIQPKVILPINVISISKKIFLPILSVIW